MIERIKEIVAIAAYIIASILLLAMALMPCESVLDDVHQQIKNESMIQ